MENEMSIQSTQYEHRFESETWGNKPWFQVKINQQSGDVNPELAGQWAVRLMKGGTVKLVEKFFADRDEAIAFGNTLIGKTSA